MGCSMVSAALGCYLLIDVFNHTIQLDRTCQNFQSGIVGTLPSQIASPQNAYNALLQALHQCRNGNPLALRLDACPEASDDDGHWWQDNTYKDVFRTAEAMYSCSGFCSNGAPVFGLPEGTVNEDNKLVKREACFAPLAKEVRGYAH